MITTWHKQAFALGKQLADAAFKAQATALQGLEQIGEAQLKALEAQADAGVAFAAEAADARDLEATRTLWGKGLTLARAQAEQGLAVNQQIYAIAVKTAESIGELANAQLKAANEAFATPTATRKAAR